jgi:hypothetical protein
MANDTEVRKGSEDEDIVGKIRLLWFGELLDSGLSLQQMQQPDLLLGWDWSQSLSQLREVSSCFVLDSSSNSSGLFS